MEFSNAFMTTQSMPEFAAEEDAPDVLPAPVNTVLAAMWVVLFGGRWLAVPLVQAAGLLSPEQTAEWDEGILTKVYLILLSITCVVLALRAIRHLQNPNPSHKGVAPMTLTTDGEAGAKGEQGA